ncbi:DinB family protein [Sporosarcina thermotolerans]|uniref:DinB family protein n=1 Tax=Sporosarcina thermotolerans TaxID=633404 RepID=A0AAW9AED2_9BACL|nr:DinB family protein [Sporosarcina thermotolerans]MDW0117973.1 DinB family protein [Sporosarcina thermotolerans]WHT49052.1 DinB family protein [Sporosarcina thermotolerans]
MTFEGNHKVRRKIYQVIDGMTDEEFNRKPSEHDWSPKQILEHLALMETYIAAKIAAELKNKESRRASKKLIVLSGNLMMKDDLPEATKPTDSFKKVSEMKEELHNSRIYLLDVYDGSCKDMDNLREKSLEHPNLGLMPLEQWFPVVGMYEKCHLKMLKKTINELRIHGLASELNTDAK